MSAEEELHEGTSPASKEPSHSTPFRLFEDVDTTDSEGEAEPGPQHAESPAPEVTPELLASIVKQVRFVRWQATCELEHRVPLDSSACTGGWRRDRHPIKCVHACMHLCPCAIAIGSG